MALILKLLTHGSQTRDRVGSIYRWTKIKRKPNKLKETSAKQPII